nr:hypothetical protein [Tanacetum cinerariifolium]
MDSLIGNIKVSLKSKIVHVDHLSTIFKRFIAKILVTRLKEQRDPRVTKEIKWLARGLNNHVNRYSGYFVKGYRFYTKEHEKILKYQNSEVVVSVVDATPQKGNTRPVVCDWVDVSRGCKQDEFGVTLVNFSYAVHTSVKLLDDPFVLASQVDKVFYSHDPKLEGWLAVRHVKVKDAFNMRCANDDNSPASSSCILDIPNLDRVGVDADEVVDGKLSPKVSPLFNLLSFITVQSPKIHHYQLKQIRLKRDKSEQKRTKPDKNGKRDEAGKSLKQLQLKEEEKLKKTKKEWQKTHTRIKSYSTLKERRKEKGQMCKSSKVQLQGPILPTASKM